MSLYMMAHAISPLLITKGIDMIFRILFSLMFKKKNKTGNQLLLEVMNLICGLPK